MHRKQVATEAPPQGSCCSPDPALLLAAVTPELTDELITRSCHQLLAEFTVSESFLKQGISAFHTGASSKHLFLQNSE